MIPAQVTFYVVNNLELEPEEIHEYVDNYLSALYFDGQIFGDFVTGVVNGLYTSFVYLAGSDAIQMENHTERGKRELQLIIDTFGTSPGWSFLIDREKEYGTTWQTADTLFFYTDKYDGTSPVCHGETGIYIPVYTLPISDSLRAEINAWARACRLHDKMWFDSGALEIPAYKQLADPDSRLSKQGRALCSQVEQATGKPTYYYLKRYYGRKKKEKKRVCPGCGKLWRVRNQKILESDKYYDFPFRCEHCRLVSHDAVSRGSKDDERYASIGEYQKRKKMKKK